MRGGEDLGHHSDIPNISEDLGPVAMRDQTDMVMIGMTGTKTPSQG